MFKRKPIIIALLGTGLIAVISCSSQERLSRYQSAIDAVNNNDLVAVSRAVEAGDAAKRRYLDGWTLLHIAARWDLEKVSRLCFGFPMNSSTGIFPEQGDHTATAHAAADIIYSIIAKGGDVTALNDKGDTPLHVALASLKKDSTDIPSIAPLAGRITSGFGWRGSPFDNNSDYHRALDIAAKNGTPVRSTADGIVSETGVSKELGNYIVVRHKGGYCSVYGHCHLFAVKKMSYVRRGDVVGYVGRTGATTGDHCHYEIRLNGSPVDPSGYINLKAVHQAQHAVVAAAVGLLLSKQAPVDARNETGRTPLLESAGKSRAISILLIEHGADVNICDENGVTPLHVAAAADAELVRILIDRGARIDARTRNRYTSIAGKLCRPSTTPLDVAISAGNNAAADILKGRAAVE
ncbi:MAG: peptidoglycan DD-metalloendopeptidase family protein [Spirochaetes bacterium]|nr:peptidoglycan DD-metalloendopeptidase family protein [Spirochaetota bacterium]